MILKIVIGLLSGGLLGFAYYAVIGCAAGSCPITSNPYSSIAYGALFGLLLTIIIFDRKKQK